MTPASRTPRRIALAVGHTAGHVMPAVAVAEAYGRIADVEFLFLASADGPALSIARSAGYRVEAVAGSALARVGPLGKLGAIARAVLGARQARALLARHGARLAIGFGGYPTGSVIVGARALGLPTAILEPNVEPGIANRWLGPLVARVYVSWPETRARFSARRTVVTGTPVRAALGASAHAARRPRREDEPARVLVMSGSRGEGFLARRVPELLGRVGARGVRLQALHHAGPLAASDVVASYRAASVEARVVPFIEDMPAAYGWADLVISRAGASTIAEIAAAGLPSLLVPLASAAADHQSANARAVAGAGAAVWTREADWNLDELTAHLTAVLAHRPQWEAMAGAARGLAAPDAAERIAADAEQILSARDGR